MLDALFLYSPVYSGVPRKSRVAEMCNQNPWPSRMKIYVDPANTDSNPVAYTFYSPYTIHPKGDATNSKDEINNPKP